MARLLFRLNDVGTEEADAVRRLLDEHQLDYYETHAGRWGLSVAAIWLEDENRFDEARELIDAYQQQRSDDFRQQAPPPSLAQQFRRAPLAFIAMLVAIALIGWLSLAPFLSLGLAD